MAMRDPGTPGRNPFFDHGPDADLAAEPVAAEELADEVRAVGFDGTEWDFADAEPPRAWPGGGGGGGGGDPLGALTSLVDALQGAQPEATEHLITAAHELVLAVKTVVDATEAALAAQRATLIPPADDGPFASPEPPSSPPSGVRRIDLA